MILNKVKVKCTRVQALRLCTGRTDHRGSRSMALPFMIMALEGVRGQCHPPAALYLRERPGTHCTGGRVGPKAGLYRCGKSRLQPGFDPRTVQSIESRYTIPAHTPPLYDVRHLPVRRRLRSPLSSHHHLHCGWTDVLPSCTCTHTLVCCLTFAILHNVEIHFYQ